MKALYLILILSAFAEGAVSLNQLEDFAAAHEWTSGDPNPSPPVILANSGPLGPGDTSLRVTSNGGSGAGSRLLVYNETAWTGDYLGQGIVSIAASLRNGGSTQLSMRLAFNGPGGWFVTPATQLTAFSGWNSKIFDIKPASLVSAGGSNAIATMSAVSQMRILHSSATDFRGAALSGSFLVDNIRAIPEPSVLPLAFAGIFLFRRKR